MSDIHLKILVISNKLPRNLLVPFETQYSIEYECEENLSVEKLENIKPNIVITSFISDKLLSWKEKSSARLVKIFDSSKDLSLSASIDDFIVLNQPETFVRLTQIIKSQAEIFNFAHCFQRHHDFLSVTVHDLKTPLTSILGFAELLQEERVCGELNPKQQRFVGQITNSANHLFQMVKDLLNYSVVESGRMKLEIKKQNLNDVLYQIYPEIAVLIKNREINYITSVADNIYGYFDEERLRQVLENLISNAVKFTSKQGMVQVSASRIKKSLKIKVSDTGIGIAEEDMEKVLDKDTLFTTKGIHGEKGTGLGVSICAEIIRAHGGRFEIESQPGEGTSVILTLPDHDC